MNDTETKFIVSQTDEDGNVLLSTAPMTKEEMVRTVSVWIQWIEDNDGQLVIMRDSQ